MDIKTRNRLKNSIVLYDMPGLYSAVTIKKQNCQKLYFIILSVQDPKPNSVHPAKGPAAGGTVITIEGKDLDTATKDDVAVTVGGVPCEV